MLFFENRKTARNFASKNANYKVADQGKNAAPGRRWGVKVL